MKVDRCEIWLANLLPQWRYLSNYGDDKVTLAAKERGYDWGKMSESNL